MPSAPSPATRRRIGQWTAFRKYADADAVMFTPQAVWAQEFLKGRKDPPAAVYWWPAESYVSCDGRTAVNTGPWERRAARRTAISPPSGSARRAGWKWIYDGGDGLEKPMPARRPARSCAGPACAAPCQGTRRCRPPPMSAAQVAGSRPAMTARGRSADRHADLGLEGRRQGRRATFQAMLWTGRHYQTGARPEHRRRVTRHTNDRAVQLGVRHLPGDHRPAGLRADLRLPDPRHDRRPPPHDGDPLVGRSPGAS